MTPNTPPRCRSCSPDIFLCVSFVNSNFSTVLTLSPDASTLELDHEHRPSPSAVSCSRNRHVGVGLGFDCGMRQPHPTPEIHVLKLPRPAALSRFLPHCCLPFLPRLRRQVDRIIYFHHYGLMATTEAAFYPGAIYYLSRWYTRKEVGFRIAVCGLKRSRLVSWTKVSIG